MRRSTCALFLSLVLASLTACGSKPKFDELAGTYKSGEGDAEKTLTVTPSELKIEGKTGSTKIAILAPECDKPGHCSSNSFVGKVELTKEGDKLTVVGGDFAGTYTKK